MEKIFILPLNNSITLNKVTLPYEIYNPTVNQKLTEAISETKFISILPPKNNYLNSICTLGEISHIQYKENKNISFIVTGKKKVLLKNNINSSGLSSYTFQTIIENNDLSYYNYVEVKQIRDLILRRFKNTLCSLELFDQLKNDLCCPEAVINYGTYFLLNCIKIKEDILKENTLSKKIDLLLEGLTPLPSRVGISFYRKN